MIIFVKIILMFVLLAQAFRYTKFKVFPFILTKKLTVNKNGYFLQIKRKNKIFCVLNSDAMLWEQEIKMLTL